MAKAGTGEHRRTIWLRAGIILLAVAIIGAISNHSIDGLEQRILLNVYGLTPVLQWPFLIITQLGGAWLLFGLILGLMVVHHYRLALRVFLAGSGAYICAELLKYLIARPRPGAVVAGISPREASVIGYGFPSGHTAVATAVALTLLLVLPKRLRWLPPIWIMSVALSRLYLGVHAPLDVIGGFAIGLIAAAVMQYFPRLLPSRRSR
jgi:glycosyltransferase 2 family protein